ncbi:hypothetical protein J3E64_003834 [Sphingobium sp. OAS761]|uniref:hypothetical protein n=1 Tax=Sphingobium sp. OAS761 TaxID=2817901 RepID=UPI00209CBBAD|nr:hypothetical protein [Sphingobium sp. OAS761]MCP1472119.1 hypothetical protein [Sphingobium sp. OAS761]
MTGGIRQSRGLRRIFALALLCVLAVRIAVPTGFMPTQTIHGVVISLCTGQGAVQMVLPVKGQDKPDHSDQTKDCPFAAGIGGPLMHPTAAPPAASVALELPVMLSRAIADLTVHRLAAPPPPSHAPPPDA